MSGFEGLVVPVLNWQLTCQSFPRLTHACLNEIKSRVLARFKFCFNYGQSKFVSFRGLSVRGGLDVNWALSKFLSLVQTNEVRNQNMS
jgi:hypothetical protein